MPAPMSMWRPDRPTLRRAALFAINIGFPILVGAAIGEWRIVLLGGIAAIMLSFADDDGPLRARLAILTLVAAGMAAGGVAGLWFGGFTPACWMAFAATTFSAGLLSRAGRGPHMAARVAATAIAIAAGVPVITPPELAILGGVFALCVLTRIIDHGLFGKLPRGPAPPAILATLAGWLRFAAAYAAASSLGLWIGVTFDPTRAIWVAITTMVVMQPDAQANYGRIVGRIIGTFAGAVAAYLLTRVTSSPVVLCAAMVAIAAAIPHHLRNRYWLHTGLIALLILLAYDLVTVAGGAGEDIPRLFMERLVDVSVGSVLALIGTVVAFPRRTSDPETSEEGEPLP